MNKKLIYRTYYGNLIINVFEINQNFYIEIWTKKFIILSTIPTINLEMAKNIIFEITGKKVIL